MKKTKLKKIANMQRAQILHWAVQFWKVLLIKFLSSDCCSSAAWHNTHHCCRQRKQRTYFLTDVFIAATAEYSQSLLGTEQSRRPVGVECRTSQAASIQCISSITIDYKLWVGGVQPSSFFYYTIQEVCWPIMGSQPINHFPWSSGRDSGNARSWKF